MLEESDSFCTSFEGKGQQYHVSAFFSSYLKFVLLIYYMTILFHDPDGS